LVKRRGVAAIELAILLPFMAFVFVIGVDYARIFYYSLTVTNCARAGARYGSDPQLAARSPYSSIAQAAQAEAPNLSPAPGVSSTTGTDGSGNPYVEVTVTYPFQTVTNFPGVPNQTTLTRTVRMDIAAITPR
jgi:Flp pilus assembly protein TadG